MRYRFDLFSKKHSICLYKKVGEENVEYSSFIKNLENYRNHLLLKNKKGTYKKCSFRKDSSLSEQKLGQRVFPSGFRPRSTRKRYLSSYSLNNLKRIGTKFLHEEIIRCLKRLEFIYLLNI